MANVPPRFGQYLADKHGEPVVDNTGNVWYPTGWTGDNNTSSNSAEQAALIGPVDIDTGYRFGSIIDGSKAAAEQASNQARIDYAEYVRNLYSAREQRDWEEYMSNTQVQRTMADLQAAGLNPWLAVQSAGFGGSVPQGAVASSSAGQAASGNGAGSTISMTAFGIAAILKAIAKIVK